MRVLDIGGFVTLTQGAELNITINGHSYAHIVYSFPNCPVPLLLGTATFLKERLLLTSKPTTNHKHVFMSQ